MLRVDDGKEIRSFGLVLLPGFSNVDLNIIIEALWDANCTQSSVSYNWVTLTEHGNEAQCLTGVTIPVNESVETIGPLDTIILLGGVYTPCYDKAVLLPWLRQRYRFGAEIGSVACGMVPLAEAGILDGKQVCVHWQALDIMQTRFPQLEIVDKLITISSGIFSVAGGMTTLDLILFIIASDRGLNVSASVADGMLHERIRSCGENQRESLRTVQLHSQPVRRSIQAMRNHLEDLLSAEDLSEKSNITQRQLQRLFQSEIGLPPMRYYLNMRLQHGRNLLSETKISITEIAIACGFQSPSHFSRCYREHFGISPSCFRDSLTEVPRSAHNL